MNSKSRRTKFCSIAINVVKIELSNNHQNGDFDLFDFFLRMKMIDDELLQLLKLS